MVKCFAKVGDLISLTNRNDSLFGDWLSPARFRRSSSLPDRQLNLIACQSVLPNQALFYHIDVDSRALKMINGCRLEKRNPTVARATYVCMSCC